MPKAASHPKEKRKEGQACQSLPPRPVTPSLYGARSTASRSSSPRPSLRSDVRPPSHVAPGSTAYLQATYQQSPQIHLPHSAIPMMGHFPQYLPLPQLVANYPIPYIHESYEPQNTQFSQPTVYYTESYPGSPDTDYRTRSDAAVLDKGYPNVGPYQPVIHPRIPPHHVSSTFTNELYAQGDMKFYTVSGNLNINNESSSLLLKLKHILNPVNASYDSYVAGQRTTCFPNTRVQLLEDIETWTNGSGNQAPIYILDGVAGIGKSTIAQTIAERAFRDGILGASFFFTMNEEERMTAKSFFPTIAFHLARHNTLFAQRLYSALEQDPDAAQKTIQQQVSLLLVNPLRNSSVATELPILMVIDALDECRDDEARTLLTLLAHHIPQTPQLRLFITTRPEEHLRRILTKDRNHKLFHLHEIDDGIVQSDIRLYLEHSLSIECVQDIFPDHQPPWQPSANDMLMLCGICGTLFIIASTATKFILDTKVANPERRLSLLLEGVSPADFSGSKRTDAMDKFYIRIISNAAPDDIDEFEGWVDRYQTIIGAIVVLQKPLPCRVLAQLLNLHPSDIMNGLIHLHSLVAPSGPNMIFRIHHKSFPDFITSADRIHRALSKFSTVASSRISKFLINPRKHHHQLAAVCFRIMDENLKFNIGNIPTEAWFLDKADMSSLQDGSLGEELTYATSQWASHIHAAGELDDQLRGCFRNWAFTHLMAWLEVMSIVGQIKRVHDMLDTALDAIGADPQGWIEKDGIHRMLSDTRRLLLQSGEVLKLTPMHIYRSALPFIPRNSVLYRTYEETKSLTVIGGIEVEWDPAALATITGHSNMVKAVAFSPDGGVLASASWDATVCLWDGRTGARVLTLRGHSSTVTDVAFSPGGSRLASSSFDCTICLWDVITGAHLATLRGHLSDVNSVEFSPDGSKLASGSNDNSIRLWDGTTGAHLLTLDGHSTSVNFVTFSPDGLTIASASDDRTICLWDATKNVHVITLKGHSKWVKTVAFSPDGSRLASGSDDSTIRLWDGKTGAHVLTLEGHSKRVSSVAFSPDGSRLASASWDHTIRLWNGKTGDHLNTLNGHSHLVTTVTFSPDSSRLASGSDDCTIRLWDVKKCVLRGHSGEVGFSPVVASTPLDHVFCSQDAKTDTSALDAIHSHSGEVTAMAHSPDSSRFVSGSHDSTLQLWNGKTGAYITTLYGHSDWVRVIAFSPDGSRLASGSHDTTIRLWDGKTGDHICTLDGHSSYVMAIAFPPDGSRLASGSWDQTIRLWDGRTGAHITTLNGHSDNVYAVTFSPDGLRLVSASYDKTLRVWDGRSGSQITIIETESPMHFIAFSPGGSTLTSMDWPNKNGSFYLRTANNTVRPISLKKHFKSIESIALLPSTPHSTSSPAIATTNGVIDPLFTHPVTFDYPLRIIALGKRENPSLSGLVYLNIPPGGEPAIIPFCWFPPHLTVTAFSLDPTGLSMAAGCKNGRVLLLDISKVSLP